MKKLLLAAALLPVHAVCFVLIVTGSANAAELSPAEDARYVDVGIPFGAIIGNTAYHISSYDATGSGVESKLDFPLQTYLFGISAELGGRDEQRRETTRVKMTALTNIGNGWGKLKDYDWLTDDFDVNTPSPGAGYPHPGVDIYSESDILLTASIVELRASYEFRPQDRFGVGPLGGVLYQRFHFDAGNLNQVGYGPYANNFTVSLPDKVIDYEVTYVVPYVGVQAEYEFNDAFQARLETGYSPHASVEDRDDHIRRSKLNKASAVGNAYFINLSARWKLSETDFVSFLGGYLQIYAEGTQTQTWYQTTIEGTTTIPAGTTITGIDDVITSTQTTVQFLYTRRY